MSRARADALVAEGLDAWRRGDAGAAATAFREALVAAPGHPDALAKMGALALALGRADSARDLLRAAAGAAGAAGTDDSEALVNLAHAEAARGDDAAAESVLRALVDRAAPPVAAVLALAGRLRDAGRTAEALAVLERAPTDPTARRLAAALTLDAGDGAAAARALESLVADHPADADAWSDLAETRRRLGRLGAAEAAVRESLARRPDDPRALNTLGNILGESARPEAAAEAYRQALTAEPGYARAGSNLLLALHAVPGTTPAEVRAAHAAWAARHADPLTAQAPPLPAPPPRAGRPLRLSLVSADFRQHPVGFFLLGMAAHLDPDRLAVTLHATDPRRDWLSEALAAAPAVRLDGVESLDEAALAAHLRAAGPDVALDLSGHTGGGRLATFAYRVAPVQGTWAAYVGTTGLRAMDVLIADRFHVPPGAEADHVERVVRLPDAYVCYAPPPYAPAPAEAPPLARGAGPVFGCFNNPTKYADLALDLWAAALARVPAARLLLAYRGLDDPAVSQGLRDRLAARGVAPERVEVRGALPHAAMLAAYGEVDVALDTAPYAGGLTTLEALTMGVPVVTLEGALFSGRHSTAYLSVLGRTEWIARTPEAYAAIAAGLVADAGALTALRRALPAEMAASPLRDGRRFAAAFTDLMERLAEGAALSIHGSDGIARDS